MGAGPVRRGGTARDRDSTSETDALIRRKRRLE